MTTLRRILTAALLALTLGACQATVTYTAVLEEDGSGTFSIRLGFDEEAALRFPDRVPAPMRRLEREGWTLTESEIEEGGLAYEVQRAFGSPDELVDIFGEIRDARSGGNLGDFEGIDLQLRLDAEDGPVASTFEIDGSVDFGGFVDSLGPAAVQQLNDAVIYRIVADLPGDARVADGEAVFDEEGRVVWQPRLGEDMRFSATSTVRNPALFIGVLLGGVSLGLAALAVAVRQRRRARQRIRLAALTVESSSDDRFDVEAAAARLSGTSTNGELGTSPTPANEASVEQQGGPIEAVGTDTQPHRLRDLALASAPMAATAIDGPDDTTPDVPEASEEASATLEGGTPGDTTPGDTTPETHVDALAEVSAQVELTEADDEPRAEELAASEMPEAPVLDGTDEGDDEISPAEPPASAS